MAECAALHCDLQSCANRCADQLSCAARESDVCAATDCEASASYACADVGLWRQPSPYFTEQPYAGVSASRSSWVACRSLNAPVT